MEMRELRAFTAVADEGSMSAASRALHLSQSALSQTIQSLERHLGVQLLLRSSTGVTLTEAGTVLLREARALITQHDRALAAVTQVAAASAAPLRVGVPLELPADLLPHALAELADRFPAARADVRHDSSAAQFRALQEGDLDIALVRERPADPDYDAMLAAEEALGVILAARRGEELAGPGGIRLDRLAALGWIGFARSEAPSWHDQVTATLRCNGVVPHDGFAGEHPLIGEVKLAAVAAGDAFALAPPAWAASGGPASGGTVPGGTVPGWGGPVPATADGARLAGDITWYPLAGDPLVRRTWAVWHASSRRRDLAILVAALDIESHRGGQPR